MVVVMAPEPKRVRRAIAAASRTGSMLPEVRASKVRIVRGCRDSSRWRRHGPPRGEGTPPRCSRAKDAEDIPAALFGDATGFLKSANPIRHRGDAEMADDDFECPVLKRQRVGICLLPGDA